MAKRAPSMVITEHAGGRWRVLMRYRGQRPTKVVDTKAEARAWSRAKAREIDAQLDAVEQPRSLMFSEAVHEYLLDCQTRDMRPKTVDTKLAHFKRFVECRRAAELDGDCAMNSVTITDASEWRTWAKAQEQPWSSNKAINDAVKNFKAMWNWFVRAQRVPSNPWAAIGKLAEDEPETYVPPLEDVAAVLDVAEGWERDYLLMLRAAGLRPGELRRLETARVNLADGYYEVWTRKRKGGAKQYRPIPITDEVRPIVRRLHQAAARLEYEFIFTNARTGQRWHRNSKPMKHLMEKLCALAEVKYFSLYGFRHRLAIDLRDNPRLVQALYGHQRRSTTEIYLGKLGTDLQELRQGIEDAISPRLSDQTVHKVVHGKGEGVIDLDSRRR